MNTTSSSQRLADHVLDALTLAVEQEDVDTSELLARALERAMTRKAGGADFTERRTFSADVERTLRALADLRTRASRT